MKKIMPLFAFLLVVLLLNSCGNTVNLAASKLNLEGSKWNISYNSPSGQERSYEIHFNKNSRILCFHPNEKTKYNDFWKQKNNKVKMTFNDKYSIYKGTMVSENKMTGTAKNKQGGKWIWEAVRL